MTSAFEFDRGLNLFDRRNGKPGKSIMGRLVLIGGRFTSDLIKTGAEQALSKDFRSPCRELETMFTPGESNLLGQGQPLRGIIIRRELAPRAAAKSSSTTSSPPNRCCVTQFLVDIQTR